MPKILILETCIVNFGGDQGGEPIEAGTLVTVEAKQATLLVNSGRALYTVKGDDPAKGLKTAPEEVVAAAELAAKAAAKAARAAKAAKPDSGEGTGSGAGEGE